MESVKRSTKLTYQLEGSPAAEPVPAAVPAAADPRRPGLIEKAVPEPDSSSLSPPRRHRVLNVYTSNENGQRAEQYSARSKFAVPALRQGESIWDRETETTQTSAEQDEVKTDAHAPTERFVDPVLPSSSRKKRKGVHVYLDAETKRAPKAASIAEMCDALDKQKRALAFQFTARVVDYYPRNCSDFVELACASCDAE